MSAFAFFVHLLRRIILDLLIYQINNMDDSASAEVKIVQRGRGKVLLNNGHQYYLLKQYKDSNSIWRCKNYKSTKCTGTVTVTAVGSFV